MLLANRSPLSLAFGKTAVRLKHSAWETGLAIRLPELQIIALVSCRCCQGSWRFMGNQSSFWFDGEQRVIYNCKSRKSLDYAEKELYVFKYIIIININKNNNISC